LGNLWATGFQAPRRHNATPLAYPDLAAPSHHRGILVFVPIGAIAMLDALGFKGIWRRATREAVIEKLQRLKEKADERVGRLKSESAVARLEINLDVAMLSDTIVIGVDCPRVQEQPKLRDDSPYLLLFAAAAAAAIMEEAAASEPLLAYRGVITWGAFHMTDRFLVGEPIDEAAQLEKEAEAAVVWLAPSALAALTENRLGRDGLGFVPWAVPLKGGGSFETAVVNPFHWLRGPENQEIRGALEGRLLSVFSSARLDVNVKRQHTQRFLEAAAERSAKE
jgi:hypothetical protein